MPKPLLPIMRAFMPFRMLLLASLLMLATGTRAEQAGDWQLPDPQQWRSVTPDMSQRDYRKAYRHNQRLIRDTVSDYTKHQLRSLRVPEQAIAVFGVAAGLAIDQDARLSLGHSKLWGVELREVADEDRSILFGIKLRW